jgi:hypothetical protein
MTQIADRFRRGLSTCALLTALLQWSPASAETATTHSMTVLKGCRLTYKYVANVSTQLDLLPSDTEAVGRFIFRGYRAQYDLYAALSLSPDQPITIPQPVIDDANRTFTAAGMLVPGLGFQVRTAALGCSRIALENIKRTTDADRALHQQKIDRALSYMSDPDEIIQGRGLRLLMNEATKKELADLPAEVRTRTADLAFREFSRAMGDLDQSGLPRSGSFDFGMIDLLKAMSDSRAADAYMRCVEEGFTSIRWKALEALGGMLPRPTHVIDRLVQMIEMDQLSSPLDEEKVMIAIVRIGRKESLPMFERLARSRNEQRANLALGMIDTINRTALLKRAEEPDQRPPREPTVVTLPTPQI